jgi:PAS domain-containing protein
MDPEQAADISLTRAVDFIPEGLAVFDADLHLVVSNQRYRELLDLPARLVVSGTAL